MSSPPWDTIPLLALKCIIEHLEVKDALAATSTCRHWRTSLLMYEGRRDLLKLPVRNLERSDHLVHIFKKYTQRLHIEIDVKAVEDLDTFMKCILPQFLDSINLQEIVFIGPIYVNFNRRLEFAQLRRIITETLLYKHAHVLESFAVVGCEMSIIDEEDRFVNSQVEYYSKPLTFQLEQPCAQTVSEDVIISKNIVNMMMFSNLKHIVFDYDFITTDALMTLSKLDNLRMLSLNFFTKKKLALPHIDWGAVVPMFRPDFEVAVNLIYLSGREVQLVIDNALAEDMPVTSFKALYLRNFYMNLLLHVTRLYGSTITEFVWADPPVKIASQHRAIVVDFDGEDIESPYTNVHPFVFAAWQCQQLEKLVIHGYWMCEYDLLGVTRLRPGIDLLATSIYDSTGHLFQHPSSQVNGDLLRVLAIDDPPRVHPVNRSVFRYVYYFKRSRSTHNRESPRVKSAYKNVYMSRLNEIQTHQLTPKGWTDLPNGLKLNAPRAKQTEYIISAVLQPWGITDATEA